LIGVAVGLGAAVGITRTLSGLLFELSATDPATFLVVSLGLVVVALSACIVPGLRATRAADGGRVL